jgi:hypothetical protein
LGIFILWRWRDYCSIQLAVGILTLLLLDRSLEYFGCRAFHRGKIQTSEEWLALSGLIKLVMVAGAVATFFWHP